MRDTVLHSIQMWWCDRFFHILRFLHFEDNDNPLSRDDPTTDWKIRKIFDILSNKFCEIYNPTEHLAVDKAIVLYKGRVIFRQYIPKKCKIWHQNLQTLRLSGIHLWHECVFGQQQHATAEIMVTHGTVLQVIRRVKGLGQGFYG